MMKSYYHNVVVCFFIVHILSCSEKFDNDISASSHNVTYENYDEKSMFDLTYHSDKCLNDKKQKNLTNDFIDNFMVGAFLHHGDQNSVRLQPWISIMNNSNKGLPPDTVGISVVPYIVDRNGNRYTLIPLPPKKKNQLFDGYYKACDPRQIVERHPDRYPTVRLKIKDHAERQQLKNFLEDRGRGKDFLVNPLELPKNLKEKKDKKLRDFLELLFKKKEVHFLREWTGSEITICPQGLDKTFCYTHSPPNKVGDVTSNDTRPPSMPDGVEPISPPGPKIQGTVHIVLPKKFVTHDLQGKMRAKHCEKVEKLPGEDTVYETTCTNALALEIDGFLPIKIDSLYINLQDKTLLVATIKIRISGHGSMQYWYDKQRIEMNTDSSISLPLEQLDTDIFLHGEASGSQRCDIPMKVTLAQVLDGGIVQHQAPCGQVTLKWPKSWEEPVAPKSCIATKVQPGRLTCTYPHQQSGPITVSWGNGWEAIPLPETDLQKGEVNLDSFLAPRWPFSQNDPLLRHDDQTTTPRFVPSAVRYCYSTEGSECCDRQMQFSLPLPSVYQLPPIFDLSCSREKPLPKHIFLKIQQTTSPLDPQYWDNTEMVWSVQDPGIGNFTLDNSRFRQFLIARWPVHLSSTLAYDSQTKFVLFESEQACKTSEREVTWLPYTRHDVSPDGMTSLKTIASHWAKVVQGKENLTACVKGEFRSDASQKFLSFPLRPIRFPGPRKIIVLAPSQELGEKKRGKAIQEALTEWFTALKEQGRQDPVTLLLIRPDGSVETVLRAEELADLPAQEAVNSVKGRMDRIGFISGGFRPLQDLTQVEQALRSESLKQVLYLTDSSTLPPSAEVPGAMLGVPLNWDSQGVKLRIATASNCLFWDKRAKALCDPLASEKDKAKEQLLQWFNEELSREGGR